MPGHARSRHEVQLLSHLQLRRCLAKTLLNMCLLNVLYSKMTGLPRHQTEAAPRCHKGFYLFIYLFGGRGVYCLRDREKLNNLDEGGTLPVIMSITSPRKPHDYREFTSECRAQYNLIPSSAKKRSSTL